MGFLKTKTSWPHGQLCFQVSFFLFVDALLAFRSNPVKHRYFFFLFRDRDSRFLTLLAPAMDNGLVSIFVVIVVFHVRNVYCCYCLVYPLFLVPAMAVFWFQCLLLLLCFVFTMFIVVIVWSTRLF